MDDPVIVVLTRDGCKPKLVAFISLVESVGNENCDPEIVFPADMYRFFSGSNVSSLLPPVTPAIVKTEGVEFVASVYVSAI